jgi:site-specific recombinase XerD
MLKINFFIKSGKTNLNGLTPIFVKIILNNDYTTMASGKSISTERWIATNKLRNTLKVSSEKVLKQYLDLLESRVQNIYLQEIRLNPEFNLEMLKDILKGNQKDNAVYLLKIFDKHNEDFKRKVVTKERSAASLQKYMRSRDLVEAFLKKEFGVNDIDVAKVNSSFIYNLESYLKYDSEYKGKIGIKNNSVVKYFKNFKTVCNYGIKLDLIEKNPFNKYDGKLNIKDATFLTQAELDTLENTEFSIERLERVKDIFLFSCYTGYAPVDACNLTLENLIEDAEGNQWIKTDRQKTGTRANVPLLDPCKKIIEKYAGKSDRLIPKLSNQKMNSYLKEIADHCKIKKHLTWYVARHTFATTVTLGNGIKIENVSAMMGHSSIKQTQHYAKVLDANVMEDMKKLMHKYK